MVDVEIEIQEVLARIIKVRANSAEEALMIVEEQYNNEEIVLDSSDYQYTDINVISTEAAKEVI